MPATRAPNEPNMPGGMPEGTTCKQRRCPKCGQKFGQLPRHIITCNGGGDGS